MTTPTSSYEFSPRHFQRSYVRQVSLRLNQELGVEDKPPEYDTLSVNPPSYHDRTTSTWVESDLENSLDITSENTEAKERDEVFREV